MPTFSSNTYTQVLAMLKSPAEFPGFKGALEANPSLHLEVLPERDAVEEGIKQFTGLLNFAAYFVGSIMAVGATLGAVNSLYSIVDSRRRGVGHTARAGFRLNRPIVASILCGVDPARAAGRALLGAGCSPGRFLNRMAGEPVRLQLPARCHLCQRLP